MLRYREILLDHVLHHCESTVNFPTIFMWFFSHVIVNCFSNEAAIICLRKVSQILVELCSPRLSIHVPSLSWNPHSWLHPVLTDRTTSYLENRSWPLRTWGCCFSVEFVSKYYPFSFPRLAWVRVCPCLLKGKLPWMWERGQVLLWFSSNIHRKQKPLQQLWGSAPAFPPSGQGELFAALIVEGKWHSQTK